MYEYTIVYLTTSYDIFFESESEIGTIVEGVPVGITGTGIFL